MVKKPRQQILLPIKKDQEEINTTKKHNENYVKHLLNFPDEIIVLISKTLSLKDIMNCRLVCKTFSETYNDFEMWKGKFFHLNPNKSIEKPLLTLTIKPSGRLCPSAASYNNSIYIYGGDNGYKDQVMNLIGEVKSDVWQYNIDTNLWNNLEIVGNAPKLTEHSAVVWRDNMILFGGSTGSVPQYSNSVYSFNFNTKIITHHTTTGNGPTARSAHSAICYEDSMYIFGGWDGYESNNDIYKLDLKTNVWSQIKSENAPSKRRAHSSVIYKNNIYIFGGFDTSKKPETFNILYKFSLENETWSEVECFGDIPRGRSRASMVEFNDKLFLIGGWDRIDYFQELHEFNIATSQWKKLDANIEEMSIGLGQNSVSVLENRMVIFGGYIPKKKVSTNELFSIRLA
ncbi:hypothetical protein PPL_03567 [Heterostelium album PN500]|uniref:F-box domain-containing protein n=1 Tax=Heterostelium pallidum (strain ATCC 26659 / Pp 5 / PN500) TaxID=670386 RepID=D3B556_HETP5|nr:hypothetical protein PPL_03567 [Heterostelium album PN500]EFA83421.1 hypothetical protein PPL_03567 [Heterostelium album PN500]|eukprot:XP_020435538.1 hypothetical protein PPL_03567 [Heterostelium album PN500]